MRKSVKNLKKSMLGLVGELDMALDILNEKVIESARTLPPRERLELYDSISDDFFSSQTQLVTLTTDLQRKLS